MSDSSVVPETIEVEGRSYQVNELSFSDLQFRYATGRAIKRALIFCDPSFPSKMYSPPRSLPSVAQGSEKFENFTPLMAMRLVRERSLLL